MATLHWRRSNMRRLTLLTFASLTLAGLAAAQPHQHGMDGAMNGAHET